ncbi:beta-propeller fold lactonase family protein [Streptomyces albogriseolus]|uniref:YVTN family beta-propeller repeat protein n=2 Tax=unclassified Streptomyces TaxID=2593676 RepID=V9Z1N7_9ACTN|nr:MULTISPECIES: YncE family protein [unclassified Streptomyces]AHE38976.1 YVTN family beta-propeller repeat protein [Streptomyces sp. FR1]AHE39460.1 YVTN family beta-propeller repeat protein [Streptomyces sp. F2]
MGQRSWKVKAGAGGSAVLLATLAACSSPGNEDSRPAARASASASGPRGTVWVAEEGGNALTAIDAATNTVVTTVSGITEPHNVQVAPDGKHVYAVSGDADTVAALDTATYRLTATGPTGSAPAHVIVTPDGAKSYVTNYGDGTVSVYRAGDLTSTKVVRVGGGPHGARPTPDGSALVVANMKAETVDIIDTRTDTKTATVPAGGPPVQVAISPDGRYAFATVSQPAGVVKISLKAGKVTARTSASAAPAQLYLTPDGRTLLSADQGSEDRPGTSVSLIDTASMAVTGRLATGSGPHGLVVDPTGRRAWVTNLYDATVSVLDLTARRTAATVKVGDEPNGISFATRPPTAAAARMKVVLPSASTHPSGTGMPDDMPGMS